MENVSADGGRRSGRTRTKSAKALENEAAEVQLPDLPPLPDVSPAALKGAPGGQPGEEMDLLEGAATKLAQTKDWYKRSGRECRHPSGCRNWIVRDGVCVKHGAKRTNPSTKRKQCSTPGCEFVAKKQGLCGKCGGEERVTCSVEGCNNWRIAGNATNGLCVKHGAKRSERRICSVEDCTSVAKKAGLCFKHQPSASKVPGERNLCTTEGCSNIAIRNNQCAKHAGIKRAKAKTCSVEGCGNRVQNNSVCKRHGAEVKRCSVDGCKSQVRSGGLCQKHGTKRKAAANAADGNGEGTAPKRKRQKKGDALHVGDADAANWLGPADVPQPVNVPQLPNTGRNAPRRKYAGSRQCSVEGCTSASRAGGGVCIKHGAKRYFYPCSFEGCTNRSVRNKLCKRHGASAKLCIHPEGCQKQAYSGGLCYTHTPNKPKRCIHSNCNNISRLGGLCDQHKSGAARKMRCLVDGCQKYATSGGMCVMHLASPASGQPAFLCGEANDIGAETGNTIDL